MHGTQKHPQGWGAEAEDRGRRGPGPGFASEHWGRERERSSGHPSRESSPPESLTRPRGAVRGHTEAAFSGGRDAASQQRLPTQPESKGVGFDGVHILILFTEVDLQAAQWGWPGGADQANL